MDRTASEHGGVKSSAAIRHVEDVSPTREVIAFARRQGGVIMTKEALDLGMAKATLNRRVADGIFVRVGRGVLALPGAATRPDALMRAAGRSLGAVVSHHSAARLHGMEPISRSGPTVTVPHRGTYIFPGLIVHQSTDLRTEHTLTMRGLRVTNPPRTVIDLAKVLAETRYERVVDNSLAAGIVHLDELVALYSALTRPGKKGMKLLGRILAERTGEEMISQTVLETRLFRLLVDAGVEPPVRQFRAPWLEPIRGRVDFAYVEERILLEADSRRWHLLFEAFELDRRRDIAAQLAGWVVIRITWKMITDEPDFVVNTVRRALALRAEG